MSKKKKKKKKRTSNSHNPKSHSIHKPGPKRLRGGGDPITPHLSPSFPGPSKKSKSVSFQEPFPTYRSFQTFKSNTTSPQKGNFKSTKLKKKKRILKPIPKRSPVPTPRHQPTSKPLATSALSPSQSTKVRTSSLSLKPSKAKLCYKPLTTTTSSKFTKANPKLIFNHNKSAKGTTPKNVIQLNYQNPKKKSSIKPKDNRLRGGGGGGRGGGEMTD